MAHPSARPVARCRPDFVSGMPIFLEILALAADIPKARFQEKEKPNFFIPRLPETISNQAPSLHLPFYSDSRKSFHMG